MLNISSSQAAIWPSTPAPVTSAAPAVGAVAPVQPPARDAQTGMGQGREQPLPMVQRRGQLQPEQAQKDAQRTEAAPLLPRESSETPEGQTASEAADAEAKAEEGALKQQLQDVLSNVWKASAAVVDVVLGRDTPLATATDTSEAANRNLPGAVANAVQAEQSARAADAWIAPSNPAANDSMQDRASVLSLQDVLAYDANGNSSRAALEAGSLLSRRV